MAEELETGALVAPFAPILSTDHEYALLARPDSQQPGVRQVYQWLQGGLLIPDIFRRARFTDAKNTV